MLSTEQRSALQSAAVSLLKTHEGFRATCYLDTTGHLTIGIGFNLDAAGAAQDCQNAGLDYSSLRRGLDISLEQAGKLLDIGIDRAIDVATIVVSGFQDLPTNAQLVCIDMIFNMGSSGFGEFKHFIAAVEARNWMVAAGELKNSTWYGQVGNRAKDDINLILHAGD